MNILYIEHYAGSDEFGMEFRPFYMAREWVKLGHKVTIMASDFSHLRKKNPTIQQDFTTIMQEGVEFVFLKTKPYKRNGLYRIINMMGFVNKVKKVVIPRPQSGRGNPQLQPEIATSPTCCRLLAMPC